MRDVFNALKDKIFAPNIRRDSPLADGVAIHRAMDEGAMEEAIVLVA